MANEVLSKFMQRTNEIKAALEPLQQPVAVAVPQVVVAPPVVAPGPAGPAMMAKDALWRIIPPCIAGGIILGATLAYFVLK